MKIKTCKICGTKFVPFSSLNKACRNPDCQFQMAMKNLKEADKKRKNKLNKAKLEFRKNDKSHLMKTAQTLFNKFIRLRDKDEPCISCGYQGNGRQWHAGHYRPVGKNGSLRFNDLNANKQCVQCNNYLSGNLVKYRKNLIKKIGLENVEWLENYQDMHTYDAEELKELIGIIRLQIKVLEWQS